MDLSKPDAASGPASGGDNAGKGKSLDDAINAASAALAADVETPAKETKPVKSKQDAPPVSEEKGGKASESAGDERDGEEAKAAPPNKHSVEPKDAKGPQEGPKSSEPPKHWDAADKQAFAALPDEAKSVLLKLSKNLEGGYTRKSQELSDKAKFADSVRSQFDEGTRAQLARAGMDEVGGVRYLVSLQRKATQDPVGYVRWFMAQTGMTPDHLGTPQKQQAGAKSELTQPGSVDPELEKLLRDPAVSQLEAELASLKQWKESRERQEQDAQRSQYAHHVSDISSQIGQFRSELDDAGQLKYPHFDTVYRHMGALMETDPDLVKMRDGPEKLDKAYDMAVWARPDLRQSFMEAKETERAAEASRRADVERAKRATAVKPAAGIVTRKAGRMSLDEALAAAEQG